MRKALQTSLFLLLGGLLVAPARAQIDLSPLTVTRTVTWNSGDVVEQATYCVESFQEAPDKKSSTPIPYSANVTIGGAATPYTLANAAGQTIPVLISWTDLVNGNTQVLNPAVGTLNNQTGRIAGCPLGNNAQITLRVLNANLGAAIPGTYSRTFSVEVTNLGSGRSRRTGNITLSVTIPASIRISDINDLVLGTFNGVNDLVGTDTLCVYKNGGAFFGITATGNGAAGAFTLANGTATVPYSVTWQDTLGTLTLAPGVQAANRGNAFTANTTCSSGAANNVTLTVRITAANLLAAPAAGLYSGVLTLMVVPQ